VIIRCFYDLADRLELSRELRVVGRPTDAREAPSPGFFAGSVERHVFVVPSPRGPCLGFGDHLVILDGGTRLLLEETAHGRVLTVLRGSAVVAQVEAPEAADHIDGEEEMNDFFAWLVSRFNRSEARAAYTV